MNNKNSYFYLKVCPERHDKIRNDGTRYEPNNVHKVYFKYISYIRVR